MGKVICRREKTIIPTYEIADYDKNPMFLDKRVYQGSSGKVYPHPVCEGVSDVKVDKEYDAIYLENDYITVIILPEIGGKIHRLYDKTNGHDAVYHNEVIKPALVGLAGPWVSGGIEFNWPQHHRPSTFDPTDCTVTENDDGSITVWVGEIEKMFHTKGMAGFTVYPDRAYVEIKGRVYNPTDTPKTFLWWANPAVAVNENTQSIFPPDVHAVMDHGKRAVSEFPIAKGEYYKVNYAPGTDISRYKNIPVPTSYMAYHSDFDFIGNYDYGTGAGLMHIADHHISPGKKQWTWGCGDFGKAWDRNLTDENGPYIELMTGMFTDNQPDFTFLKPYEEKTFVQYFMPYKGAGAIKNASKEVMVNVETLPDATEIKVYTPVNLGRIGVELVSGETVVFSEETEMHPCDCHKIHVPENVANPEVRIVRAGEVILKARAAAENTEPTPLPAEALPAPEELETNEKLFLAATHLEQYRHATYSPEPYYLEGLRRDPTDIRLNNGYGKYLYNRGLFSESEKYFRAAIKSSTWKNPNPYDCEPYYNLGLSLERQGRRSEAFDAYYKAAWDGAMQDKAFYRLACIAACDDAERALDFVENSLVRGAHNMYARTLKTALLRRMGRLRDAEDFAKSTQATDPLDHGSLYELYKVTGEDSALAKFKDVMRGDNHNYIELALRYTAAGMADEAKQILRLAPRADEPMTHYYLFAVTGDKEELAKAENADCKYCFPNRLDDIAVLESAIESGGEFAKYYLGNLLYDKSRHDEAAHLWESCAERTAIPTVYRNLSLAYFNKLGREDEALAAMEKAFELDRTDARVFFELDQLYKRLNATPEARLENMRANKDLLERRDDLYTEYITLLNLVGEYETAYNCIMSHNFHPWEGGEGKIPAQYRMALMNMADAADDETAVKLLEAALVYPHCLGEGKLIGNLDNDIYYMLGCRYKDEKKSHAAFEMAARGDLELSTARYYNDQPPEMMYYAARALEKLGDTDRARQIYEAFIAYGDVHMNDKTSFDYFAVSLPDFLIFEADTDLKNRVHCLYMKALGCMGLGKYGDAAACAENALSADHSHAGAVAIMRRAAKCRV